MDDEWRPVMAMLVFNLISAVMTALVKKALQQGLNALVLITLRQLVATLFLAPIAYFKERNTRPKLTLEIFVYHFFSAALGASLSQYSFFYGLKLTTATFAITFANMAPVLTFLIAIALRVCKDGGDAHVARWSAAAEPLQGHGRDTPQQRHSSALSSTTRQRRRQEGLDAGDCSVTGQLPRLLPVVAAAKQADEQVPGALLQHRLHVLHQHAADRIADGDGRVAPRVGVDCHKEAGDGHDIVFGNHGVCSRLPDNDLVRPQEGSSFHCSLHPHRPDHGGHHRFLLPP
ncbi:nodulin protein isoform X1 [Zea mays]|uniref:nodulin protein isoform X1 n=1 Tax=Zea mays TaxID=4577 RepID=UPI0004DEB988|nr:nodulin protein isoform X1 [Zea mays]|eukprot:XP_008677377.1 nodulin protein isoform X1 [Zea mays]